MTRHSNIRNEIWQHLVSKGEGIHAREQGGVTSLIFCLLHGIQGLDLAHLEAQVIGQERHSQVVLVLVAVSSRCPSA